MVRYNEQDGIVCACPDLLCGCDLKKQNEQDVDFVKSLQLFARKRLEVWTHQLQLVHVVSSEKFGQSFSSSGQGPTGNWPRYQFWSGARVRSPMFAYDAEFGVFGWVESQAREIEINFIDVERDVRVDEDSK